MEVNIENDVPLMIADDPLECSENECDEDETGCKKCCACELENNKISSKPCVYLICTFCIEEDECLKCHKKIAQNVPYFLSPSFYNAGLLSIDCSINVCFDSDFRFVSCNLDVFWSIPTFQTFFSWF